MFSLSPTACVCSITAYFSLTLSLSDPCPRLAVRFTKANPRFLPLLLRSPISCATRNRSPFGYHWLRRDARSLSLSWRRAGRITSGSLPRQVGVHVEMSHKLNWSLAVAFPSAGWFNPGLYRWRICPACQSESQPGPRLLDSQWAQLFFPRMDSFIPIPRTCSIPENHILPPWAISVNWGG